MSLTPRGMSVQEAYRLFSDKKLIINRSYQRKLVWSVAEKQHLIDSIQQELPIPLFMLAKRAEQPDTFEIIDGMQRLNAIFSFIEHQFLDESDHCFDLEQSNRAKLVHDAGGFTAFADGTPRMSPEQCAKFLEYQLAVTIDNEGNEARINEVFGRINSGGRQLSPQEQRQAGLVSDFSEFVRRLSLELRGDSSPDLLLLNAMPEVSFNTPKERQRYGIDAIDVFWCKHGIMNPNDLARSEDEQIVTDIAASLLQKTPLNASREVFDKIFEIGSDEFKGFQTELAAYGTEKLRSEIILTIGAIRSVFETGEFLSFRNCVHKQPRNPARTSFFAVFMAFHNLIFSDGMFPDDLPAIRAALNDVQKHMIRNAHHATTADRKTNINVIKGLIQGAFIKKDVTTLGTSHGLVIEIENSLRRSKYEASRYEFKLGICKLSDTPCLDDGIIAKISRTAAAIANTNPSEDGYVYLGVADNQNATDRVQKLFGIEPIIIGACSFVGLGPDLQILGIEIDEYLKLVINGITASELSNPLKTQLLTAIDHAEYKGRPFIRLRIPAQAELTSYAGQFPVRKDSQSIDMSAAETLAQSKLFT